MPTVPDPVETVVLAQQNQLVALTETDPDVTTRSGRRVCHPLFFEAGHANCAFFHTFSSDKSNESVYLLQSNKCSDKPHPFAFAVDSDISVAVSSDPNTMILTEALQQPDYHEFINAMEKELRDHIDCKH